MKTCPRCKIEKEVSEFYVNPNTGKSDAFCRPCKQQWARDRRVTHKAEYNEAAKRWRDRHPEEAAAAQKKWRAKNPEVLKAHYDKWAKGNRLVYEAKRRDELRKVVFAAYGGHLCVCCGETEPKFLTLDHINNDGGKHRREINLPNGGTAYLDWLKRNKFPPGLQVLCYNCNMGRARNGGTCPHRES